MTALTATRPVCLPTPPAARPAPAAASYGLGFAVFLVLNATLFVRPAEIVPDLLGLEIYLGLILVCFILSFPAVLAQLSSRVLDTRPITVCVLGLGVAVTLSHLSHADLLKAWEHGFDSVKIIIYYLLFLGLVTTPARLRSYLSWLLVFATVVAALAVLQYHGAITLPNLDPLKEETTNASTGDTSVVVRLRSTGIFQDPNDLCSLLVVSVLLCLWKITDARAGLGRLPALGALALFLYALALTHSRGGMLALLVGLFVYLRARFGARTGMLIGALLLPVLLALFAGRQTSITTAEGTSQDRIQLWSDGYMMFRSAPVFGIGRGNYAEQTGLVAHNSYIHAFAELGFFGGCCFAGAVWLAIESLWRLTGGGRRILDPDLRHLHPYLLGLTAGYATAMMSLSLCYILPTYTVLALGGVYLGMVQTDPPATPLRLDGRVAGRVLLGSVGLFVLLYVFVRVFINRGG